MKKFCLCVLSLCILTGCLARSMRPPPQSRSYFYKPNKKNVNDELIKSDVEERGCENIGFVNMSDNKYVESQICMLQKGHKNRAFKKGVCSDLYFGRYCSTKQILD